MRRQLLFLAPAHSCGSFEGVTQLSQAVESAAQHCPFTLPEQQQACVQLNWLMSQLSIFQSASHACCPGLLLLLLPLLCRWWHYHSKHSPG
jgi:hypothetical protein